MFLFKKDPTKEAAKQQIKRARDAIDVAGGELVAWGKELLVDYKNERNKQAIINALTPLGWVVELQTAEDKNTLMLSFFRPTIIEPSE